MSRPYSDKLLAELNKTESDSVGVRLAKITVELNLPMTHLANGLGVSRWTLHKWFRGEAIAKKYKPKVEHVYENILFFRKSGMLPTTTRKESINFVKNNLFKTVETN